MTFANLVPKSADTIIITGAYMRILTASLPAGMTSFRLHIYTALPTAIVDNAAFTVADADRGNYIGYIPIGTPEDIGGNILWSQVENINFVRKLATGSTTLYCVLQTIAGFTPTNLCVKQIGLCVVGR